MGPPGVIWDSGRDRRGGMGLLDTCAKYFLFLSNILIFVSMGFRSDWIILPSDIIMDDYGPRNLGSCQQKLLP